jgi:uncharacterized membrane protein (DUF2068 family)
VQTNEEDNGVGYRLIGAMKLASALLLGAAGFGIFRLLNRDLGDAVEQFAYRLHLDPENWLIHEVVYRAAGIDQSHLKLLGAGTFFYAGLEGLEGIGLLLRRRWAEYLTVVATGLLMPPEMYEIVQKPSALRVAVLLANLGILVYLISKLVHAHRVRTRRSVASTIRT